MKLPKQIVESDIKYDGNNSEAFVYKFICLTKNNRQYGGYHKGKPGDGYMNSSKNKEFAKDWMNPKNKWRYEVNTYGDKEYCKSVENRMLEDANAKDSPNWYNDHNGGSKLKVIRTKLVASIATQITENKSYKGITPSYIRVKDIPGKSSRLQIREFTLDPDHITKLRNIINDKQSLDHLMWVSVKNRTYRGQTGEIGVDGNHSIESAETSDFGGEGQMPSLRIPNELLPNLTDDEIDLLAMMLNPRTENPRLQTDFPTIARMISNQRIKGLDSNSKEIQEIKDFYHLTTSQKAKVSKLANDMYKEQVPNEMTWVNYGAGDEKKEVDEIISDEHITNDNRTGIFSKCYSTAMYHSQNDLYEMMIWNRDNPHNKITTYRIRWYHKDKEYKDIWESKWQKNNEFMIDKLLKSHGIKRKWTYLKETRNRLKNAA
tara:strand:- start:191 stop:1483 length:1293 start_codon:yes stop_codon:yes gene_type:complete